MTCICALHSILADCIRAYTIDVCSYVYIAAMPAALQVIILHIIEHDKRPFSD